VDDRGSQRRLVVSGGSEKFGDVRAELDANHPVEFAPFGLWRAPLEDWLRATSSK
jgi:hypothetical protein